MAARHIGAVLVMAEGRLVGIFTERDMVNRVAAVGRDPDATKLDEVMTAAPRTIEQAAPALAALRVMQNGQFRHLPVMRDGRLVAELPGQTTSQETIIKHITQGEEHAGN